MHFLTLPLTLTLATGPPLGQSCLVVALILSFLSPQLPVVTTQLCVSLVFLVMCFFLSA